MSKSLILYILLILSEVLLLYVLLILSDSYVSLLGR
jgi:hypothetical protein